MDFYAVLDQIVALPRGTTLLPHAEATFVV
jgi:hypothetical protein